MESRLSKEQIFEDFANEIDLGQRGGFRIRGFNAASQAYFGKDLSEINLPEAAGLAGMLDKPEETDPFRHPDVFKERRNLVLDQMNAAGYLDSRTYGEAILAPVLVAQGAAQLLEAPYFIDFVNNELANQFQDTDFRAQAFRAYTTLDLRLQNAAGAAIRKGMPQIDEMIRKQPRFAGQTPPEPQVALVAIDPHSGALVALAGGRVYGETPLDRSRVPRRPGAVFMPFVYAAALNTGLAGGPRVVTPASIFPAAGPASAQEHLRGAAASAPLPAPPPATASLRELLLRGEPGPMLSVARGIGYDSVAAIAKLAGLNHSFRPDDSLVLGEVELTPFELAAAYSVFANGGVYVKTNVLTLVRADNGASIFQSQISTRPVLDPRVAFLATLAMQERMRPYALGFPAAGMTGAGLDGWFAGFTSQLLCLVWVGFDNGTPLGLTGDQSAGAIWAAFMKSAVQYSEYRPQPFPAPDGIVTGEIDLTSGLPATPRSISRRLESFIAGTQPAGARPVQALSRGK